jgi:hypothetical protein
LRAAAVIQAAESVLVLVATVLVGVDAASGQSYHVNSGIALTVLGVAAVAALALVAAGLARARRWSRTPALLTQLFAGIVGIYLLQGHRIDWGLALVVLAVLGFAALLSPPSIRALTSHQQPSPEPAAGKAPSPKAPSPKAPSPKAPSPKAPSPKAPSRKPPTRRR